MVGLIIAIELAFADSGSINVCRSQLPLSWRQSSRAAAGPDGKADILCFGDSMVKLGVLPCVIEDCLGLSTYNLAVLAGQPASSYFLFRQALARGHRPRAVIVDFSAPLLGLSPHTNVECWAELADCRDAFELAIGAGDPALCIAVMSRRLVPSRSRYKQLCPALVMGEVCDTTDGAGEDNRAFERNWRINRGAQIAPRKFIPIKGALAVPPKPGGYRWQPKAVHAEYVARFLSLARAHAIPVFWVLPPVVASRHNRLESSGITSLYQAFAVSFLSAYPSLTVLDGQNLRWDERAFRDPIHLNRDGAVAFSRGIANMLNCRLGPRANASSPRWVNLSASLDVSAYPWDDLLEDLDQSRRALGLGCHSPT
jgi:hypothetical protein